MAKLDLRGNTIQADGFEGAITGLEVAAEDVAVQAAEAGTADVPAGTLAEVLLDIYTLINTKADL